MGITSAMFASIQFRETKHTLWTAVVVFFAEVLGTAMLMFLGCMGGMKGFKDEDTPGVQGAVVFGLTVCSIIQMLGHVSGAHLNPSVTVAAWLWGSISLPIVIIYIIAQIAGAIAGFYTLAALTPVEYLNWGLLPNDTGAFCTTTPAPYVTTAQAFVGEFLVTGMLILLCCGCWDSRNKSLQDSVALKFGVLVAAISASQGPITGASMNPARTLAPSMYFDKWDRHWLYWVAPLLAGIVVPVIYKLVFMRLADDKISKKNEEMSLPSTVQSSPMKPPMTSKTSM